jgi:hypothetical protein
MLWTLGSTVRSRHRALAAAVALGVALGAGACAEEAEAPETASLAASELEGWVPVRTYAHDDVVAYDQVAAAPAEGGAVWFTRASRDRPDLAVWTMSGGQEAAEAPVSTPEGIVIPVAVASGGDGWTAVAVTRDQPATANTGVLAWRSEDGSVPEPAPLSAGSGGSGRSGSSGGPGGSGGSGSVPASVTVARSGEASLVTGVVDGRVASWLARESGWTPGFPELSAGPVVSARVTGTADGFLLAAVSEDGAGHLWSSPDGLSWSPLDVSEAGVAEGLAAVGMLTQVGGDGEDGSVVAGWLEGDATAEQVALASSGVRVLRIDGTTVEPYGTIEAEPGDGVDMIDVNGAVTRGDWVLIAGAAMAPDGSARPGLWAGTGEDWGRSEQNDLVDQPDVDFRTIGSSGEGSLYGVLVPRGHIDVEVWQSEGPADRDA